MSETGTMIRAAQTFEAYVRYGWPVHRRWAQGKVSNRCQKCAISEHGSALDSSGICALCRRGESVPSRTQPRDQEHVEALTQILREAQHRGPRRYDALVLFSGGKDSAYLIRRIQREAPKLRMLALTVDNTFMSPVARNNAIDIIRKLDVDHVFYRHRRAFMKKLFRYCITHLNDDGGYGTVDFSDGELLLDTARHLASEQEIPLILCGYSRYQVENGLKLHHFESPREIEESDRTETAGIPLTDIFQGDDLNRWRRGSLWSKERIARLLFPLYAWDLEETFIRSEVIREGLVSSRAVSPIVTNHALIPLLGVVDVHRMGYSSYEIELCRMVREGKADRAHWQATFELLEYCARTGLFLEAGVRESLAELDLTLSDVGIRFAR